MTKAKKPVRMPTPGKRWRVLAHGTRPLGRFELMDQGVFDELVVDGWIHLEQMTRDHWWMQLGPLRLGITLNRSGRVDIMIERDYRGIGGKVYVGPGVDTGGKSLPNASNAGMLGWAFLGPRVSLKQAIAAARKASKKGGRR